MYAIQATITKYTAQFYITTALTHAPIILYRSFVSARNASSINKTSISRLKFLFAQVPSNTRIMDEFIELTLESLQAKARKTNEIPPRIAVYDVIAMVKRCDQDYAGKCYMRLLNAGRVPECEEVGQELVRAIGPDQDTSHWGGNHKPVRVATAGDMIQILMQLPGNEVFKKNCASVVTRFLGGDYSLMQEVAANRAAQEQLARDNPDHPLRICGEEVEERGTKRAFEAAVEATIERGIDCGVTRLANVIEKGIQSGIERATQVNAQAMACDFKELHAWDFSKPRRDKRLEELGVQVEGAELERLNGDEGVVRSSDYLETRSPRRPLAATQEQI